MGTKPWIAARRRRIDRGATGVEYALGVSLLAGSLLIGLQAFSDSAADAYDDRQAHIGTPVTDGSIVASTSTTAGPSTTVTLPPTSTTSTTQAPTITFTATARSTSSGGNGKWVIDYTVSTNAPTGSTVTVTWSSGSSTCSLASGSCSGTTHEFNKSAGAQSISSSGVAGYSGPTPSSITVAAPA